MTIPVTIVPFLVNSWNEIGAPARFASPSATTGSIFVFLAAHRQDGFADEEFEDLFPSGRVALDPSVGDGVGSGAADPA
jgi:hypothetical protein